jgi:DNA segregation ATPase FtsK/SpoIIIE, S-DNA-T family
MNPEIQKLLGDLSPLPSEAQIQVINMTMKMISLGFIATFKRLEEGPIVRTYFFEPAASSALSKIIEKEEDLALSLKVESVIISRERGEISIAVPRSDRQLIRFDQSLMRLLKSQIIKDMTLPILMGQTPRGEDFYIDLADQPHLLIAGSTGSGKSIFTSQVICSLALLHSAKELKFTLVDTKQLDLTLFEGLFHIKEVIQDIHGLRHKLLELLDLVRSRTTLMSGNYRNIKEYNKAASSYSILAKPLEYHVLIIDEFADVLDSDKEYLSTLHPKMRPQDIASLVKRLAQISRAAGVHLIIATQRPSVKVISGDIKTNFPARICFKLPSMADSRVVLDENGAEKLLGRGDYLYKTSTSDNIKRGHSAFVSINDIAVIIAQSDELRRQYVTFEA